jgi:hypothetical protein
MIKVDIECSDISDLQWYTRSVGGVSATIIRSSLLRHSVEKEMVDAGS